MRQAGRSLPAYREVRRRHSLLEICSDAALCAEVTLQPVSELGVDAAIIFADIMLPVIAMGVGVELVDDVGPVVAKPIRTRAQVEELRVPDFAEALPATVEAVRLARQALDPAIALIGFAGAPFTLAGYLVEGRPSRDFARTKALMLSEPETWRLLMETLARLDIAYLSAQVSAGVQVVQLFDSWVGCLSPADYRASVQPHRMAIFQALAELRVPAIHFSTGTAGMLAELAAAGGDVMGVDWRISIGASWQAVGPGRGIQGNLDPAVLLGPWEAVRAAADGILEEVGARPGHVFNLGHGVLPDTPLDNLRRLVAHVRESTARSAAA
jgi:uroporphyrinogen decarboxylase